ncbi:MAG TPA: homoserine dehydrogenase [Cytophagales bacterium]|nr:homoserine dehydrogenase [Cytophagales bacterium]HAP63229.1 homoserine dehydrogenase [Cytophagales bacterium]
MQKENIRLGIFGFGCVGQGLYQVLQQTQGIRADIARICIKNPDKPRPIATDLFTTDRALILDDPTIDVVVELIDDAEAAFEIVTTALSRGKAVVSANKKMIAEHLEELVALQKEHGVPLLYEGSCCASIPIIRNLEEYYDNDLLTSVEGIFNGSTNYILTKIFDEGLDFQTALKEAQDLGFAETDPSLDIEGWDPKYKLVITLLHAFGVIVSPEDVFHFGIHRINDHDIAFARQRGLRIKLLAQCQRQEDRIHAYVLPKLINGQSHLTDVNHEYNGVVLESAFSESQLFVGKGAGDRPTGSAVLSDISALTYQYKYEYKKRTQGQGAGLSQESHPLKLYIRYEEEQDLNWEDFLSIEERYQSQSHRYVIGTIDLNTLAQAEWLQHEHINILGL